MISKLKHTAKHTIIYSLGNLSSKLIGFVLLPLYTTHLSTTEYGMWGTLEAVMLFVATVFGFRLSTAMMRWYSTEKNDYKKKSIIYTAFISTVFVAIFINIALFPFRNQLSLLFFKNYEFANYFPLLFLSASFEILNHIAFDLIRIKEKSIFFVVITTLKLFTILILNIYFIVYLNMGIKAIIISQMIGSGLLTLLSLPFILKHVNWKFDFQLLNEMFKYGFPLIFTSISAMILNLSDRFIIPIFHDYSDNGIYTVGYKIASVVNVVILQSFQLGFLPIAFNMFDKPNAKRYFSKVLTYFSFILIIAVLALSLFSKEIIETFAKNQDYWLAYSIIPIICLTFVFKGIQYVFSLGLHYTKKTKYNAYIVLTAAIFHIGLNIILIPIFNIYGAAITTVCSSLLMVILYYHFSNKFYRIDYEITKILKMLIVSILLYLISLLTNDIIMYIAIIIKLLLIISFPFILYFLKFYEDIELITIKKIWLKWKNPNNWIK